MLHTKQVWILILFCAVYISWGLTDSIQAPFYPIEAESKGATISEYGFVFGIIHLAIFVSGPIFGKHMHALGLKNVYIFGVISTGVCALLFGFLDFVHNKVTFLAYSYILRVLEGVAEAASWSAVFAMLLQMFPNNVATVYSFTEASFSFSEMIGPTLGAFLYSIGGFVLPFELCGVLCLVTGLCTILVIPSNPSKVNSPESPLHKDSILLNNNQLPIESPEKTNAQLHQHTSTQILPVLKNVNVLLALSGTVYAAAVQGLLEACLEPYLEQFHLSITKIGLTFLALSVPYFMASPLWGYFCDHLFAPELVQCAGSILVVTGFLALGPAPYLPVGPNYPTLVVGLAFLGIGTAAGLVASFSGAQQAALVERDLPARDIYPAISGIWTSSFALGNFLGPSAGGLLYGSIGFRNATAVFQVIGVVLMAVDAYRICRMKKQKQTIVLRKVKGDTVDLYERL